MFRVLDMICPNCNSENIRVHELKDIVIVEVYECNECGKIF